MRTLPTQQVTIESIAALTGVSRSTVSRVLNNHPHVRAEVRERIERVIAEQGYTPHAAARSLVRRRTGLIGLLVPRSTNVLFADPLYPAISQGIVDVCTAHGYFAMIPLVTHEMEPHFLQHVLHSRHFDGIIMAASDVDDPILPHLLQSKTPLVRLARHPYLQQLSWVDADNRAGGYLATTHLLRLGHQHVATITGPLQEISAVDRRDGYKQALMENGRAVRPALIAPGDWTQESGYRAMQHLLTVAPRPTAVFAANDRMALGAMQALGTHRLAVPQDVALVGFDDLPLAAATTPALTTVRQPFYEMGRALAETLLTQVEQGRQRPQVQRVFSVELVVRASCGAARPQLTAATDVASSPDESADSPRPTLPALRGDTA